MERTLLFTDGSVDTKTRIGYGAYLCTTNLGIPLNSERVNLRRFEDTSSTKLELQTLIWALGEIRDSNISICVYTDSQNTVGLLGRRERLEKDKYRSKSGKLLNNHELYKIFYELMDQVDCEFVKVSGHMKSSQKNYIDKWFTLVDRATRKALKDDN